MLCLRNYFFVFILIFSQILKVNYVSGFNVKFHYKYDVKVEPFNTQIFKREMSQFFDKASFSFNGFEKIESVPVLFPIDICLLNLDGIKYATSLHMNSDGIRKFVVFKSYNGTYELLADIPIPTAIAMDCISIGSKGYIAIAINATTPIEHAQQGSPIFEISNNRLRAVQYFSELNLYSIYLLSTGNDVYLLQTFRNTKTTPNLKCPYYKWSGTTFNKMGGIPCSNARHLEPFSIDYESYVAVANYADQRGRTKTNSEIYKFNPNKNKFQLMQKIKTNGAVDVKYFNVPTDDIKRKHFLIFGNSISTKTLSEREKRDGKNLEADSVFYIFDKEQFMPYQSLSLYAVEQFLPVQNSQDAEKFILLVASANQDIKIYNFNDWKFEESSSQFTQGALSRGVAKMRIFQQNDDSYLVIANELMADNETNIFLPIFKQDEHANALRQQIIDWTKDNIERLTKIDVKTLQENVQAKLAKFQQTEVDIKVNNIPEAKIERVTTQTLNYPRLHVSTNYWKALSYANRALDALQTQFETKLNRRKRNLNASTDGTPLNEPAEYDFAHLNVDTFVVRNKLKTQRVNGVNAINPIFDNINAKKVIVVDSFKEPTIKRALENASFDEEEFKNSTDDDATTETLDIINVENLQINGKLNEYTWSNLINNTLKRKGDGDQQILKAPVTIQNLKADTIMITNENINGENLKKLVSTKTGDYVINQDIRFAAPVKAENLLVHERLNNIHVHNEKLGVLLKHSNETQIVDGPKRCNNVRVMQPITISGRILGEHLNSLSPHKAIHDTFVLNGDYNITSNVTITKLFKADNLIDVNNKVDVKQIFNNAIYLNETLENVNLKFEQSLVANNSILSFVNGQDLQHLVKTNIEDAQVVQGEKFFQNTLQIHNGFAEVKILNGIDVEELEKRLFLKHKDQTINVPMHFGNILAKAINSIDLTLGELNLTNLLTKRSEQFINGTLKVKQLNVHNLLQMDNLNTNAKIFDKELTEIYQQKTKNAPNAEIFHNGRKFKGSIYIKNLLINTTINDKHVRKLEDQLTALDGNIKYVGNYKFNYNMNIENLTFSGKLNGIPANEFGRCWLQKSGAQIFTAPQTFATVAALKGIELQGKLNGMEIADYFEKTYWINRNEYINEALFQNPIQIQNTLITNTLNNLRIPGELLYRNSMTPQELYNTLSVNNELIIDNNIYNTKIINAHKINDLENFLNGYNSDTLHLENVNFNFAPNFQTLNKHNLRDTLDVAWLINDDVYLQKQLNVAQAHFEGLLNMEGPINNINMEYIANNYFSLTMPQKINTEIDFQNEVQFENDINVNKLELTGVVVERESNTSFNFIEFVSNTLKTAGNHKISGKWHLNNVTLLAGDLDGVLINNLNLRDDVLRNDIPINKITAKKHFGNLNIQKLYATPTSNINNVDVNMWLRHTVFKNGNHTINGQTTLNNVNINKLEVQGTVNNMSLPFNTQNLLLRDRTQTLQQNVKVQNRFISEDAVQRILSNNFENLQTNFVNGWDLPLFLENSAKNSKSINVKSHLSFKKPVHVKEYSDSQTVLNFKTKRGINAPDQIDQIKDIDEVEVEKEIKLKETEKWFIMENTLKKLEESLNAPSHFVLDHFEIRQSLRVSATHLIPLTLRINDEFLDVIGIYNETFNGKLQYYRWNAAQEQFIFDKALSWLPQDSKIINLLKLSFENTDYITIVKPRNGNNINHNNIISHETADIPKILQLQNDTTTTANITFVGGFQIANNDCFVVVTHGAAAMPDYLPIYCFEIQQKQQKLHIYEEQRIKRTNITQVLAVSNNLLALLFTDALELWSTSERHLLMVQRIPLLQPKQMAVGQRNAHIYLAVLCQLQPQTLQKGNIEIFSATKTQLHFEHIQTLDCLAPQQIAFSTIPEDLLLHVITRSLEQPLNIFQYNGVVGFKKIVGSSTLPLTTRLQIVHLKASKRHLVALFSQQLEQEQGVQEITFMEIVLKQI